MAARYARRCTFEERSGRILVELTSYRPCWILGAFVSSGSNASLAGTYVFLDVSGAIFTVPLASLQPGTAVATSVFARRDPDFLPVTGTITQPVAIVQDAAGAIYIAFGNGDIFRAIANKSSGSGKRYRTRG